MSESDLHWVETTAYVVEPLVDFFATRRRVHVASDSFVYYRQGDRRSVVSPDCYVVRGVAKRLRRSFRVWEEGGRTPCFVLEVTSESTRRADEGKKLKKYRDALHVPDYFLFDPTRDWIPEALRGYRLVEGGYRLMDAAADGRLPSHELALDLGVVGTHLRYFVPGSQDPLPTRTERAERAERALTEKEQERARAELDGTRALVERLVRARFRDLPAAVLAKLGRATLDELYSCAERAATAKRIDDVFR
jgi:Uma2 family endonuclease